jgi:tRNA-splicing ligase RtcB
MRNKELIKMGFGTRLLVEAARHAVKLAFRGGLKKADIEHHLKELQETPSRFTENEFFAELANKVLEQREAALSFVGRQDLAPYKQWGTDIDDRAIEQMKNACSLPVAAVGALMPDAHVGYGLPIGGVLATRDAVIPYAVGVDIACRVKITVLDLPPKALDGQRDRLRKVLERETRFGIGSSFKDRRSHDVLDADWSVSPITQRVKDKAWAQLGTSGSGNHFVEYGLLELGEEGAKPADWPFTLEPGVYLAVLSHSGSRGPGAMVASHYSRLAMDLHPELPKELMHLAWLDMGSEPGQEYWQAMQLMGRFAEANHACIHHHLAKALGADVLLDVENHHNFAWLEEHQGETLVVHRKGATPAGKGALGIIPGSMASPAFLVRGLGNPTSLLSAAHGAGRVMSRTQAKKTLTWSAARKLLDKQGVELLSSGIDEVPMVYRDIEQVMAAQRDLVEPLGRFHPKIVKMAPAGERPED